MKFILRNLLSLLLVLPVWFYIFATSASAVVTSITDDKVSITDGDLGFVPPSLSVIMGFAVKGFFAIAGVIALYYLLMGALKWVSSAGEEKKTEESRKQIMAALVGLILIVVILAVIVTLEQVVFQAKICLGISCPLSIPNLISP